MTGPIHDDELRAMLAERASRVSPDAQRAAMAAFRASVHGASDGKGGFAVVPQALSSRGARLPWSVAAMGMVAVVVVAIVGGRLGDGDGTATPSVAAGSEVPVATPWTEAGPVVAGPDVLAADELEHAIDSGDIAHRIVVLVAQVTGTNCEPTIGCDYSITALPGVSVTLGEDLVTGSPVVPVFDAAVRPYAFRVGENGDLTLLGVIGDGLETPLSVEGLPPTTPGGRLILIDAWIVSQTSGAGTEPCSQPKLLPPECSAARAYVLSSTEPRPDGSFERGHATSVDVAADARPGLFPPSGDAATFLLRRSVGGWRVEGRYVAIVPSVEPRPSGPAEDAAITAEQLRAGLSDGSLAGRLVVVSGGLQRMQVPCREPLACTVPTLPGLEGVRIEVDPSLEEALASQPPGSPLVFVVEGDGLTLMGSAASPQHWPITVGELAELDPMTSTTRVPLVVGSLGIPLCLGGCPMSSARPGPASWLSDPIGTGNPATVPVELSDPMLLRTEAGGHFLMRGSAATGNWVVVAVVRNEPIIRVSLP